MRHLISSNTARPVRWLRLRYQECQNDTTTCAVQLSDLKEASLTSQSQLSVWQSLAWISRKGSPSGNIMSIIEGGTLQASMDYQVSCYVDSHVISRMRQKASPLTPDATHSAGIKFELY